MATPRFNENIFAVARLLSDERTDASASGDTGKTYKSAVLTSYQNSAIKAIVQSKWEELGISIQRTLPEVMKSSETLTLASGYLTKPDDAWYVIEMATISGVQFTRAEDDLIRLITGADKIRVPSATFPYFYEEGRLVKSLGVTAGEVLARYVVQPADLAVNGTDDVILSSIWDKAIRDLMLEYAMKDTSMVNPA